LLRVNNDQASSLYPEKLFFDGETKTFQVFQDKFTLE
jgi:hypothetical protein